MGIPRDVHQVRAFLGMYQQLTNYVSFYAIIAAPLHALTKSDGTQFPRSWVAGSNYDVAFHRLKAAMLHSSRHGTKTSESDYSSSATRVTSDLELLRINTSIPLKQRAMTKAWQG
jgi:hypothetical protein